MNPTKSIKVKEIGTELLYIVQLKTATVSNPNTISFDHKFHLEDLNRIKGIGKSLGLKVVIENSIIEFQDFVKIEMPDGFDFMNFMNAPTPYNYYQEFCTLIQTKFEVC